MRTFLAILAAIVGISCAGCGDGLPAHDKDSLVSRVEKGLREAGAPAPLERCLTKDLDRVLTEEDAERAYSDLASNPDVSERSLNVVSLLPRHVRASLKRRVGPCEAALTASGEYTRAEFRRLLRRVGKHAYRWHPGYLSD